MLDLHDVSGGCEVGFRVQPGSRRSGVFGTHGDRIKIAVQAPPVDGRANEAVVELVAEVCGVPRGRVSIRRGQVGRDKTVLIEGLTAVELRSKLAALGVNEEKPTR